MANEKMRHDKFFTKVFSKEENLISLLQNALPKSDYDNIDIETIKLSSEKSITDNLKGWWADIIVDFKMNDGSNKKIAILIEHKSSYKKLTLFQILKYSMGYWAKEESNNATGLTPIIPVLFFHGTTLWNEDNRFTMCFDGVENGKFDTEYLPNYKYVLFDLNKFNVDEDFIGDNIEVKCALSLMKYVHSNLVKGFNKCVKLIDDFFKGKTLGPFKRFVKIMLNYIIKSDEIKPEVLQTVADTVNNYEFKGGIMTLEQELEKIGEERGEKRGKEKGKTERNIEIAKNMKRKNYPIEEIIEITGLTIEEIEEL